MEIKSEPIIYEEKNREPQTSKKVVSDQGTRTQVGDSWSIGDPSDCIGEMTEFAVLGRHLMKDQKSHNLCIVADIQQLLMNLLLMKQYEVLKINIHCM